MNSDLEKLSEDKIEKIINEIKQLFRINKIAKIFEITINSVISMEVSNDKQ